MSRTYPVYTIESGKLKLEVFNTKEEKIKFLSKSENREWKELNSVEIGLYLDDTYKFIQIN